ncbi:MAG: hypothetical protein F6K47_17250 [Symploca sp. SIO2E6]|nr:hypothetical protein [Symploca sp. SIO2E6]
MKLPVQNDPVIRDDPTTRVGDTAINFGTTASFSSQEADCRINCAIQFPDAAAPNAILCSQHCQNIYDVPTIL